MKAQGCSPFAFSGTKLLSLLAANLALQEGAIFGLLAQLVEQRTLNP
jgi:hypothetical protein